MIERRYTERGAQRPWSGGRPWRPPTGTPTRAHAAPGEPGGDGELVAEMVAPRAGLAGTGAVLAAGLAAAEADLDGAELTTVGVPARAHLVDIAVAAERVAAWALSVQARAVAGLHAQFMAEHDLDDHDLDEHAGAGRTDMAGGAGVRWRGVGEELAVFAQCGRATTACLSLALGVSSWAADRLLAFALGLAGQPDLALALAEGRIDASQARTIQDATTALPAPVRDRVVASLVTDPDHPDHPDDPDDPANDDDLDGPDDPAAPGDEEAGEVPDGSEAAAGPVLVRELADGTTPVWAVPAHQLRPILARQIAALAPDTVQDGEQVAVEGRRVEYAAGSPARSGFLVLHGPEPDLAAAYDRLDTDARTARRAGAPQTLDQLRYDLAIAALTDGALGLTPTSAPTSDVTSDVTGDVTGRRAGQPRPRARRVVRVDVIVAADTLLGVDDQPATLRTAAGDVPISAAAARRLAHDSDATWRRILTDPATGTATDLTRGYTPAKAIAEYVKVRDGHTSRFPTSSARTLELDHITPYDHTHPARGGPTTPANLAATGKRDHQTKTDHLITLTGNANTVLTYQTGAGHTYPSPPHHYTDPDPPPY